MKNFLLIGLSIFLGIACSKPLEKINYKCEHLKGMNKFIYEDIIISDKCNCIVSGKVKYVKDCMTVALIDYGEGECDNIATKILCDEGNCFGEDGSQSLIYEYTFDCNENNINEGFVSNSEMDDLNNPNNGPQP